MRMYLLLCCFLTTTFAAFAQAPVIEGDVMLCPYEDGTATITGNQTYETYQWYYKYWFLNNAEFEAIEGATSANFTYDWMTYDQALLKVVVTQGGETYESNTIQVDSYAWASLTVINDFDEDEVYYNPEQGFMLCEGATITNTVSLPYTILQWYKDGVAIEGATAPTYVITDPGTYHVVAAPGFCPTSTSTSIPLTVVANPNCEMPPAVEAPVIAGDVMLCPYTDGTAEVTNEQTYDTYQWYYKYWFLNNAEFEAIEGATSATFTYDWMTYDQALLKLVVTSGDETFESNTIQIDSYNWSGLLIEHSYDENLVYIHPDNGHFMMCPGTTISNSVTSPYTIVQWYKNGEPIEGATNTTYVITEPGIYNVVASPEICPNASSTSPDMTVELRTDCTAGIDTPEAGNFTLYPNPASSVLNITLPGNAEVQSYTVYDVTGKTLMSGALSGNTPSVNIESLASGTYLIKIAGNGAESTKMFIKQ